MARLAVTLLLSLWFGSPQRELVSSNQDQVTRNVVDQNVTEPFIAEGVTRLDVLLRLAKRYQIPMGVEYAGAALFERISVRATAGTVGDVLGVVVPSDSGFRVSVDDRVLVVSHRDGLRGDSVLSTVLDEFSIPESSIQQASVSLAIVLDRQQTPGATRGGYGVSVAGRHSRPIGPFTAKMISVRSALNRIVRDHGTAAWIVQVRPGELSRYQDSLWAIVDYDDALVESIGLLIQHKLSQ